ncbi:acyl-CoA dehydrogenase family protein [soil metagenome]
MTPQRQLAPLVGDFYGFQDELSVPEAESVERLRGFLETHVRPIADDYWARAEFPHHLIQPIADLGLFGDAWPQTRRFENSSLYRAWCWMEIARVDPSMTTFLGVQAGLAMGAIGIGGSPEQHEQWLRPLARGEVIGAFGLTEPLSGSDAARGLRTTARREGDEWVLDGAKRWIGNATFSDIVVIMARDVEDEQVKAFIVRRGAEGFTASKIENKTSLRIVQNADITLEGVRVPESDRLPGIRSFKDVATILRLTRAEVAWQALGTSMGAYEAALAYAGEREQFGAPIASRQLVQDLLARCLGNITASMAMCVRVSRMQDRGEQSDAHAALAKGYVTTRARETVAWAREILGGNGIVLGYGVARHFADMEAIYSFEGTREMNSLIVGRAITGIPAFA